MSELSAEKRCAFVERVLDHYDLHEVNSEAFHRVVASLEEASWETLKPIMVAILGNTPVPTDALSPISYLANGGADVPLNRIETAAILHHIYHTLWTSDATGLTDGYDGERVYVDDDFAYYLTSNGMWDSEDKSSVIHIDVPQAYTSAFPDDGYAGELLLSLVENLTLAALDEAAEEHGSRLLQTLAAGLGDDSDSALLIVPTSSVEKTEDAGVLDEISDSIPDFAKTDETADS